jgi:hypothetical protein
MGREPTSRHFEGYGELGRAVPALSKPDPVEAGVLPALGGGDDLDVGRPGVVVDGDVDVVVAHPRAGAGGPGLGEVAAVGAPAAAFADVTELVHIDVHGYTGRARS